MAALGRRLWHEQGGCTVYCSKTRALKGSMVWSQRTCRRINPKAALPTRPRYSPERRLPLGAFKFPGPARSASNEVILLTTAPGSVSIASFMLGRTQLQMSGLTDGPCSSIRCRVTHSTMLPGNRHLQLCLYLKWRANALVAQRKQPRTQCCNVALITTLPGSTRLQLWLVCWAVCGVRLSGRPPANAGRRVWV